MNKSLIQRIRIGLKKGYSTPTLPENLISFQLHPLIRIFRFLGGISFLSILGGKNYFTLSGYIQYICIFIATLFTIYPA